jgi:hypothetical protein
VVTPDPVDGHGQGRVGVELEATLASRRNAASRRDGDQGCRTGSGATSRPTSDRFRGKAVGQLTECLDFWENNLHDPFVLDIIRNGYKIPIAKDMARIKYREDNNANAKKEEQFVIEEVKRLIAEGLVVEALDEPLFVSPPSVAIKIKPNGEVKKRLVFDLKNMSKNSKNEVPKTIHRSI